MKKEKLNKALEILGSEELTEEDVRWVMGIIMSQPSVKDCLIYCKRDMMDAVMNSEAIRQIDSRENLDIVNDVITSVASSIGIEDIITIADEHIRQQIEERADEDARAMLKRKYHM